MSIEDAYDNLFVDRIKKKAITNEQGCWIVQTSLDQDGYYIASYRGKAVRAHKKIYIILKEEIPKGMVTDHLCKNRACCNPRHIEIVTSRENIRRGISANRNKTHCPKGHKFTLENTYIEKAKPNHSSSRHCKICRSAVSKKQWIQKLEARKQT